MRHICTGKLILICNLLWLSDSRSRTGMKLNYICWARSLLYRAGDICADLGDLEWNLGGSCNISDKGLLWWWSLSGGRVMCTYLGIACTRYGCGELMKAK